jgi:hypothetical protein
MSKVVRLPEDAIEIALKYGTNLAEGIRTMDKLIQHECKFDLRAIEDLIETKIREVIREELEMLRY